MSNFTVNQIGANQQAKAEVFKCEHLAEEGSYAKQARAMFSKLETTDWQENIYNNTIAKVFIFFSTAALPIDTIVQAGCVMNMMRFDEADIKPHLMRLVRAKLLRTRKGKQKQSGVTLYEVAFKGDSRLV